MSAHASGPVQSGFELVERVAGSVALQRISFDRDETDSYRLSLEPLGEQAHPLPSKADILPLLPAGSRWVDAVGWRSFVALPFVAAQAPDALLIGAEGVVPHLTRGAFPIARAFLIPRKAAAAVLQELAARIHGGPGLEETSALTYGVIASTARTPSEHHPYEAWMLRQAAACYRSASAFLLRTLLLSEDQVPGASTTGVSWLRHLAGDRPALGRSQYLVATVPSLRERFSLSARIKLKLHEYVGPSP
jgi:hypothetical protein